MAKAAKAAPKSAPRLVTIDGAPTQAARQPRQNHVNLFDLAYDRLEELIVSCVLKPGQQVTILELQSQLGLGRTPVHQAVNRLASDTIIIIRPRHGLQVAPVDLARERMLLRLRRDIERFVVQLASERAKAAQRSQLLHIARSLRARRETMTVEDFNLLDRRIDRLLIAAADEPFLEHTMRPLQTISRRVGWLYHRCVAEPVMLLGTIDRHTAIIEAVANRHVEAAMAATDSLIDFVDSMFETMESEIDPSLLDCSFQPLVTR